MERDTWYLVLLVSAMAISILFLCRLTLISSGWLKAPILRQMQSYSQTYLRYYPLPAMFSWAGVFLFCVGVLMMIAAGSIFPAFLPGFGLLVCSWLSVQFAPWFMQHDQWILPAWYRELDERTSRDEQRRIAYAWLRLPRAVHREFNRSDAAFAGWADLVLLSMTNATADTFVYAPQYRLIKARRPS